MVKNIFEERKKINDLLDKVSTPKATYEDIEKIINKLVTFSHKNVVEVLIKRLEGNNEEFHVSHYILSEIGDERISDDIIKLIFKESTSDQRKAMLIHLLDELDIDTEGIDFSKAFNNLEEMSKSALDSLLNEVNNNQLLLDKSVEWLYDLPEDARYNFIENLCSSDNKNVFLFLQKFLTTDDIKMATIILKKLSQLNQSEAYNTIKNALPYMSDKAVLDLAERTLRKLSLKGVEPDNKKEIEVKLPKIHKILISNIDGTGSRSLIISRIDRNKIKSMFILINEKIGIKDSFGNDFTKKEFEKMIDFQDSEGITLSEVSYEYAVLLIKDAIKINYETKTLIPPTFHFMKDAIFEEKIFEPQEYIPTFEGLNLNKIANDPIIIAKTNKIFEYDEFFSWFLYDEEIKDFYNKKVKTKITEKIINEFIDLFIVPEIKYLKRRLILAADLIYSTMTLDTKFKRTKLVKLLLCSAMNIEKNKELPFLKELATASLNNVDISSLMGNFLQVAGDDFDL